MARGVGTCARGAAGGCWARSISPRPAQRPPCPTRTQVRIDQPAGCLDAHFIVGVFEAGKDLPPDASLGGDDGSGVGVSPAGYLYDGARYCPAGEVAVGWKTSRKKCRGPSASHKGAADPLLLPAAAGGAGACIAAAASSGVAPPPLGHGYAVLPPALPPTCVEVTITAYPRDATLRFAVGAHELALRRYKARHWPPGGWRPAVTLTEAGQRATLLPGPLGEGPHTVNEVLAGLVEAGARLAPEVEAALALVPRSLFLPPARALEAFRCAAPAGLRSQAAQHLAWAAQRQCLRREAAGVPSTRQHALTPPLWAPRAPPTLPQGPTLHVCVRAELDAADSAARQPRRICFSRARPAPGRQLHRHRQRQRVCRSAGGRSSGG